MRVEVDLLGAVSKSEEQALGARLMHFEIMDLLPGDGVVISQQEGQPPRIAYLNRRILLPNGAKDEVKLIFEVGEPQQQQPVTKIDQQKLFTALQEFVVRKSAAFSRPDMAAKELTDFFTKFMGG